MKDNLNGFRRNIVYAFIAQFISLSLSLIMSLIVPKILGLEQYGYWQLFLFYAGYVGYCLIGINDGIYLRTGGQLYSKLDYKKIGTQYYIAMAVQLLFAALIGIIALFFVNDTERKYVLLLVAIFLFINNATGFLSSILQAVNNTYQFSTSVMLEKVFFIVFLILSIALKVINYKIIILGYVISRILAMIYSVYCCKEIVFGGISSEIGIIADIVKSIKAGFVLLISNIVSVLILGIGRQVIDLKWGVEAFARISFSLSITNFFLQFINQISMVLFPTLRLTSDEKKIEIYRMSRVLLSHVLTGILVFYVPIVKILEIWLPDYQESLKYLIFTLVICIFDGKMQMLYATYMKVLRKEKVLLVVNVISITVSAVLCFISAFVLKNFYFVVLCMTISIAVRSILSELYIGKILEQKYYKLLIMEVILSVLFIYSTWFYSNLKSFILYLCVYFISVWLDWENIKKLFINIKYRR